MAPGTRTPTRDKNEKPRLKKPAMEKMRRDRINTGIQRLKLLLKDELKPKYKLEKANVLEQAVAYLKKRKMLARASPEQCYTEGFVRCLEETARFLSVHNRVETGKRVMMSSQGHAIHPNAIESISVLNVNTVKSRPECTGAIWRPW